MPMEYTNRRGQVYYIYQGKTKTGKPKYYASKRATSEGGEPAESLPEDFEIFEDPGNATVIVRRRKASRILPAERELIDRLAVELSAYSRVQTIIEGDQIEVYVPDRNAAAVESLFGRIFGSSPPGAADWTARNARYTPELRFALADAKQCHFTAKRYCYRGSIDGWIPVAGRGPLEPLARELLPHLGRESFYELF